MAWVCLMYHDVVTGEPKGGGGRERFSVSKAGFERMLDGVHDAGYRGCTLEEAIRGSGRRVAITFDDGSIGQWKHALPALEARGMTATFFVTTDWVGRAGYMEWDQLRSLVARGMSVQSHTKSHPHLAELDASGLRTELRESKSMLDAELDQETTQIALPGGNAPRRGLRYLMSDCGYDVIATSRWGRNPDGEGAGGARWVRRCTAPRSPSRKLASRIAGGDPLLTLLRYPREAALNGMRAMLGPSRYARWRRRVLNTLAAHGA